jgi:hypothetical protein
MDISRIKLPIAVIGIVVAQAFGIIWYVATLDSTVGQLQQTVEEIRLNTAETSVAVIQNDIANIKTNVEKLEQNAGAGSGGYDDSEIWAALTDLDSQLIGDDNGIRLEIEQLQIAVAAMSSKPREVTPEELEVALLVISTKLQNILDGKGATWKKSALKARIDELEKTIEKNHPPKKTTNKKGK